MNNLLIHDLAHEVRLADLISGEMIIIETDHLRQALVMVEESSHEADDLENSYIDEMADLHLKWTSCMVDYDTALGEKAALLNAIGDIGYLIAEGNFAAAQTLIEELTK